MHEIDDAFIDISSAQHNVAVMDGPEEQDELETWDAVGEIIELAQEETWKAVEGDFLLSAPPGHVEVVDDTQAVLETEPHSDVLEFFTRTRRRLMWQLLCALGLRRPGKLMSPAEIEKLFRNFPDAGPFELEQESLEEGKIAHMSSQELWSGVHAEDTPGEIVIEGGFKM